ncbi:MAG: hypothetical protein EXS35_14560 [Pedosphaera sp.]|nr:hypothetical protein [Pedosphaera sp.]
MNQLSSARLRNLLRFAAVLGLSIVALRSPAQSRLNITLVSSNKPPQASSGFGDVWGDGNLACLGVWTAYATFGFGVYNIANPAAPQLLTVYNYSATAANRFEQGVIRSNILYVGSWGGSANGSGLHIFSITNPVVPALLSRITASTAGTVINGFNDVHTLFLERNFLYEAAHNTGIVSVKVFDVSNPAAPVYVRDVVTTNTTKVHQMTVRTNQSGQVILYTSGWGGASTGNPASPGQTDLWDVTQVGTQPAPWLGRIFSGDNSHSSWPTPDGNTLIVCRETAGGEVKLYDISNPGTVTNGTPPLATITPAGMGLEADLPHNPVVVGNFLFLSWYQNGLQIFDITDRTRPVRVGFYDTYAAAGTSSFQGNWGIYPHLGFNKLLVSDIQSGFYILDASAVLTPTNNYPPLILAQPVSITTTQGANVVFTPVVTGSLLNYQWRLNGVNLAGATASSLALNNVQPAQAGNYSVVVSNATASVTSATASLSVGITDTSQTSFSENFDSASSSNNWDLFQGSGNGTPDYTVDWSFDYSTYFSAFNGATIPAAPNTTNGTTRGVRLTVNNNDAVQATAAVSLYPKNKSFSGAYKLKADMWINYPGTAGGSGSTGSTEHGTFGLNHTGTRVNWHSANPSDGVWFAVDGEGGTTIDYRAYTGDPAAVPALLSVSAGGFAAAGAASRDNTDPYWQGLFPSPTYESGGAPGKKWVQVEVGQSTNNILTWRMNGNLIAQRTNTSTFTNGNITIGYMDAFTSIASPAADAFILFDNVRVEIAGTSAPPVIVAQPEGTAVYPDSDATFSVAATGSGTLSYQWLFNGAVIPGATSNSYTRVNVQPEDAGNYSVIVSNNLGTATSANALLLLLDSPFVNGVTASPGARSALISWTTTVAGNSQVQFDTASFIIPNALSAAAAAQGSFSTSSYTDPALTTSHVILLTGLQPGTRYSYQTLATEGTNTYVSGVYQFTTAGALILDNPDATFTGSWTDANVSTDKYLTNYFYATTVSGAATATATWRPNIITPGKYDVSVWYPQGANRATNAPYLISYNGGSTNALVNQQSGGGGWRLLAAGVELVKGTNAFVRLSNNASNSVVIADAVKFDYVEAQDFPTGPAVPAWWANFYFGGAVDTTLDADGDAYTTAQEYVMGTCPTNAASHLELAGGAGSNRTAAVTFWPFLANRTYDLLFRTNLSVSLWQKGGGGAAVPTPDGRGIFSLGTTNDAQNYFRLKIQMSTNGGGSSPLALPGGFTAFTTEAACGPFRVYVK